MPCPSARTKLFLSKTKYQLSKTKFCPTLKIPFFAFKSHLIGRALKIYFQPETFILNDFSNKKIDFLILDKIFVLNNFNIAMDKKYFVWADGRGMKFKNIMLKKKEVPIFANHTIFSLNFLNNVLWYVSEKKGF